MGEPIPADGVQTPELPDTRRLTPGTYELTKRIEVGQDGAYRFVDMPDGPDAEYVKGFWHKTRSQVRKVDPDRVSVSHITDDMAERLATALALALYEGHPTYGSTAGWRGGVGGQAVTPGCAFIDPPPGFEFLQYDLLSTPLREFLEAHPFDLNQAKADLRAELEGKFHG